MNYGELQKLYPDFKIPYEKEAVYYLNLLLNHNPKLQTQYADYIALSAAEPEPGKHKLKMMDIILQYFKNKGWDLNSIDNNDLILNSDYTEKEFNNYKPDKFYISIDLKEANWQSFKFAFALLEGLPDFEKWSIETFALHPAIARSKSFRQYLFGNTNPKRLQRIQKGMMGVVYNSHPYKNYVVGKKADELIFEFDNIPNFMEEINISWDTKISFFTVHEHKNYGEFVRVKHKYADSTFEHVIETQLMGVPGNRFFIHYKTLILIQQLEERDLYFVNNKHLAKWIL